MRKAAICCLHALHTDVHSGSTPEMHVALSGADGCRRTGGTCSGGGVIVALLHHVEPLNT